MLHPPLWQGADGCLIPLRLGPGFPRTPDLGSHQSVQLKDSGLGPGAGKPSPAKLLGSFCQNLEQTLGLATRQRWQRFQ